ncbi:MAG: hypothetical protein IPM48_14490 [Saprospiraceae bacterium]|nr:hypothetical protein [Saprospiraceae bacterium]
MAKTFFYKRIKDGEIIAMEEREASLTGKFFEFLGSSDGNKFQEIVSPSRIKLNQIQVEMNELLKNGLKVPKTLHTKFAKAKIEFQKANREGFNAELEIAKQNKELPRKTEWSALDNQKIEKPDWAK